MHNECIQFDNQYQVDYFYQYRQIQILSMNRYGIVIILSIRMNVEQ